MPGLECAGELVETGERVMALLPGAGPGGARRRSTSGTSCRCRTRSTGPRRAASWRSFATAHDALFTQAELRAGERLLVNGAAGGVGTAAVQLGFAAGAT